MCHFKKPLKYYLLGQAYYSNMIVNFLPDCLTMLQTSTRNCFNFVTYTIILYFILSFTNSYYNKLIKISNTDIMLITNNTDTNKISSLFFQ